MADAFPPPEEWDAAAADRFRDECFEPGLRRIFRSVVDDRIPTDERPPHSALLFGPEFGPFASDREFASDFYNDIHHQGISNAYTAQAVPMVAALASDERVPADERASLTTLLFHIAAETDRLTADCWPRQHPQTDPAAAARARAAVRRTLPELAARWDTASLDVRLALAALCASFPKEPASLPLLERTGALAEDLHDSRPLSGFLRFALLTGTAPEEALHTWVDELTSSYWRTTPRELPARQRAVHLLDQMLAWLRWKVLPNLAEA
ncbi:hypothetical protein ACIBCM_15330 [Streptomyces sp. NPDC051018]|uniref:hypothetical protein n=1 Tax=Streptomyces sp. NPDC051018 TaxID=3365639 RepID=UPI0037B682E9